MRPVYEAVEVSVEAVEVSVEAVEVNVEAVDAVDADGGGPQDGGHVLGEVEM